MKYLLAFISPRLALLASLCVCIALAALLALTSPLQIVISIQPLGSAVSAAPAAILPTVTPPPPPTEAPPTATEAPPPPTAISTAEPTATEAPPAPTAISTAEPTATAVPHTPTEPPPAPTELPPTVAPPTTTEVPPTAAPPAPTELPPTAAPPTATEVPPTAAPPAPTELPPAPAPVASSQRRIERAPDSLPNTADPEQAARFVTSYLPMMGLALALLLMGWLVRSGAFRQRVLVDLSPSLLTPQRICLGELQIDPYQVRARWRAGSSVAALVEDLALHNQGVSRIALTLAVQEALHS